MKKTGNRITPGQVIREIVVKHRVKRELVRWLKEYGNQKLGQEKKIVNGKQVKDLWKMESQDWRITGGQGKREAVVELTDGQAKGGREVK